QLFCEIKYLARLSLVFGYTYDAIIDGPNLMLGEFLLHLVDDRVGRVMIPANSRLFFAKFLAWIKLDYLAATESSFLDGLENGEAVKGVSLATNGETTGLAVVGNTFSQRGGDGP